MVIFHSYVSLPEGIWMGNFGDIQNPPNRQPAFPHHCWRLQASNVLGQMLRFRRVVEAAKESCEVVGIVGSNFRINISSLVSTMLQALVVPKDDFSILYFRCVPWTTSRCCPVVGIVKLCPEQIWFVKNDEILNDCLRLPSLTSFVIKVYQQWDASKSQSRRFTVFELSTTTWFCIPHFQADPQYLMGIILFLPFFFVSLFLCFSAFLLFPALLLLFFASLLLQFSASLLLRFSASLCRLSASLLLRFSLLFCFSSLAFLLLCISMHFPLFLFLILQINLEKHNINKP